MIKNYSDSLVNQKNTQKDKPDLETVSFILNYSKSFDIKEGKSLKKFRLEKN